ncbi:MAG TPA: POTRA domain-containing protein [Caulobacteraceae bacterium]|jgi:hemolysin activation/secretion protein
MRIRSTAKAAFLCVFSVCAGGEAFAQSQAPSRVTPETFAPPPVQANGQISIPAVEPGQVPAGAEQLSVTVAGVTVEGGSPRFTAEINSATAKIKGVKVTVKELYGVAAEIEAAYARAGYVLTRVTVPPQQLVDGGPFKIIVLDGFIESVDVSSVPARQREAVRARVASLIGRHGLTMDQIERRLLIAGDVPGLRLRSALIKGTEVGGARLVLEGDWKPVSASIGVDNLVGPIYNNVEFPVQASLNSVLGLGELIYGSAITGPDGHVFAGQPVRRIFGVGAVIPIGVDGWTINPEYTNSNTDPREAAGGVQTTGVFERFALRTAYPIVRSRSETLSLAGSFEALNETQQAPAFGTTLNKDRLRIFTLGLNGSKALFWNDSLSGGMLVTQGVNGLGARDQADATASGIPLSRQGSRPDYSKFEGYGRFDQSLPTGFSATLFLRGQESFTGAMPSAAQFSLDGLEGLSTFPMGTLNVDSGVTARVEFAHLFPFNPAPIASLFSPYVFAAVASGSLADPTAVEKAHVDANAFGGGLRLNLAQQSSGVTSIIAIEVGHDYANIVKGDDTRVTVNWTLRY